MSKHGKRNHHGKSKRQPEHKAQVDSPAAVAVKEAKAKSQEATQQEAKAQTEAGVTLDTDTKSGQITAKDSNGQPVPTKADEAKLAKLRASQARARQTHLANIEAQREAKRDYEEICQSESGLVKTMVSELEGKIEAAQAIVTAIDTEIDNLKTKRTDALAPLNEVLAEYKSLTGLDKRIKASNSKSKGKTSNGNGNGRFVATVKQSGDCIKVLVTHTETKSLFETSIYPKNGTVKETDWLALRHRFVAHFEAPDTMSKVDREAIESQEPEAAKAAAKAYNLTLRAYLSNLKGKIEAVKPIV